MLPAWMDVTFLERMSWAMLLGIALLMLFAIRRITRLTQKIVALVFLFGLAIAVWTYRDDLGECRRTCSCTFMGLDVDFSDSAQFQCDLVIEANNL